MDIVKIQPGIVTVRLDTLECEMLADLCSQMQDSRDGRVLLHAWSMGAAFQSAGLASHIFFSSILDDINHDDYEKIKAFGGDLPHMRYESEQPQDAPGDAGSE
mgnify:CR=1 FL=1